MPWLGRQNTGLHILQVVIDVLEIANVLQHNAKEPLGPFDECYPCSPVRMFRLP